MSVTYDVSTPVGLVRLLSQDFDPATPIFQDEEHLAFLGLNAQDVRLAAAQAVDVIAASETYVQKRIKILDLTTDGPAEAKSLHEYAAMLRTQVNEGYSDGFASLFDWAESVLDAFSERQRVIGEYLRHDQ